MPETLHEDPYVWFRHWFDEANAPGIAEPNAMTVSTLDEKGAISARIVYLKAWDESGFVFYTNLNSHKGQSLKHNPVTCLSFFWSELRRQIRIEGRAEVVSDETADAYFATRHRTSQIGAWASAQSDPLSSRDELLARVKELESRFPDEVPRPPHWSGFRVVPNAIEFWQAGEFRLHDRWRFEGEPGDWKVSRLNP